MNIYTPELAKEVEQKLTVSKVALDEEEFDGVLISEVIFSHDGGSVSSPISLTLQAGEDEEIRYTEDNTEPKSSSILYNGPIDISSNTIIRAKAFKNHFISAYSNTRSYFFNISHDIPFVSLVTNPLNLFDNQQIQYLKININFLN